MDNEAYLKKIMILILKKHEEKFNDILISLANFLKQDIKNFPKDIQSSVFNSMLLMVFINCIATTMIHIPEDEFEDALSSLIESIIDACEELRERFPL